MNEKSHLALTSGLHMHMYVSTYIHMCVQISHIHRYIKVYFLKVYLRVLERWLSG